MVGRDKVGGGPKPKKASQLPLLCQLFLGLPSTHAVRLPPPYHDSPSHTRAANMERHFSRTTFLILTAGLHRDKVPKWSRAAFQDKFNIMKGKLEADDEATAGGGDKYSELDSNLAKLQRKLREGNSLETGQRGANKVSALAEELFPEREDTSAKASSKVIKVLVS